MWRRINYVLWLTPADVASSSLILCGELAPPNIADSGRARNRGSGRATIRRRMRSGRVPGVEALLEVPIEQAKTSNPKASSQTRSPTGGVGRRELAIRRFVCISRRSRTTSPGACEQAPFPSRGRQIAFVLQGTAAVASVWAEALPERPLQLWAAAEGRGNEGRVAVAARRSGESGESGEGVFFDNAQTSTHARTLRKLPARARLGRQVSGKKTGGGESES